MCETEQSLFEKEAADRAYEEDARAFLRGQMTDSYARARQAACRVLSAEVRLGDWRADVEEFEMDLAEFRRDELSVEVEKLLRSQLCDKNRPLRFAEDDIFRREAGAFCDAFWKSCFDEMVENVLQFDRMLAGRYDRCDSELLSAVRRLREAAPADEQIYYDGYLREAEALAARPLPEGTPCRDYAGLATRFVLRVLEEEPEADPVLRKLHAAVLEAWSAANRPV